ncbi:Bidirectional sugar transporter SWEET [Heracleum sosnowskyi]|uniref:Bidirectional sugar transporter SWEET n=1 Tax=Heracleum sosnowskyi TaxID=360622 RepID=A0AAD8GTK8_9APIA|nr:Bidirectional sugar transporter SWEET [Heracleum sosnowskyi]
MAFINHHLDVEMVSVFGILGNIVSFLVYLAPLPTFLRIYKKKSTEGFQAIPYIVALFSAMLTLYYGMLKTNGVWLITINTIGILIESAYILLFMIYAPKDAKKFTATLLFVLNGAVFGTIILTTLKFSRGHDRITIVGWICAVFSVCVFVAPLSIMRLVIRTKSVEFMPLSLSFFLTICAVMWFFYGVLSHDLFVATPNVLGFAFGILQMVLYLIYKDKKKHGIQPITNIDVEMQVDQQHVIPSVEKTDFEMPEDDIKKNSKIDSGKTEADHQEVVVSVVITDHDGNEAHVHCNTILAVEY